MTPSDVLNAPRSTPSLRTGEEVGARPGWATLCLLVAVALTLGTASGAVRQAAGELSRSHGGERVTAHAFAEAVQVAARRMAQRQDLRPALGAAGEARRRALGARPVAAIAARALPRPALLDVWLLDLPPPARA